MLRIDAIALDALQTCLSLEPVGAALPTVGLASEDLELWFALALRTAFALQITDDFYPFKEVLSSTLEALAKSRGQLPNANALAEVVGQFARLPVYPDVRPAIELAHRHGIRVAVVTNGSEQSTRDSFAASGLDGQVDCFLSIDEVRQYKPSPAVYEAAAVKLALAPPRLALIAAHDWDVHGAKVAGLVAGYLHRPGRPRASILQSADVEGEVLSEIVAKLVR